MTSLDVSIVIPCYNQKMFIRDAIISSLAQNHSSCEIIVIDDGSSDGSLDIIKSFGNSIYWETGPNRGANAARNRGLELARGEYVKFLDADDVLLPDSIAEQIAQTAQLPSDRKAIVYGDAIWIDHQGRHLSGYPYRQRQPDEDGLAHFLANNPLTTCPLHRREYVIEVGGFGQKMSGMDEHELHLRLVLNDVHFIYIPCPVYKYRQHEHHNRLSRRVFTKYGALSRLTALQEQIRAIEVKRNQPLSDDLRKLYARAFWASGRAALREGFALEADNYFNAARELDPRHCVTGKQPYVLLVSLLGPKLAERCMVRLRRILSPNV